MTDGWLYLDHPDLDMAEPVRIPDDPDVRAWHEARGWNVVDAPAPAPFVPPRVDDDPDANPNWVELVHPDIQARHQFPNNGEALAGAYEKGWVEPNKDGSIPKAATAKRRAAAALAITESSADDGEDVSEKAEPSAAELKE